MLERQGKSSTFRSDENLVNVPLSKPSFDGIDDLGSVAGAWTIEEVDSNKFIWSFLRFSHESLTFLSTMCAVSFLKALTISE